MTDTSTPAVAALDVAAAVATAPQVVVEQIHSAEFGNDGPLFLLTANGENGLESNVVDIRNHAGQAFAPRTADTRFVTDTASFIAETVRRPLDKSLATVWGNRLRGEITAIYDDLDPDFEADYRRRTDRLILKFVPDPDWAILFAAADGKYHGQEEFADLIEQAGYLITSHQAADLMEMVQSVRTSTKGEFQSEIKRDTGSQTIVYSEEVSASAGTVQRPLEVPREITFTARPFEDYPSVDVDCWLRLRPNGGRLGIGLFPKPYHHHVRDAWESVVEKLADDIGSPIYASNL